MNHSFAARLPEKTTALSQKLGGPKQASPNRPAMADATTGYEAPPKPGAHVQRHPLPRPRRTLERVLTDDKSALKRRSIPSLTRSVTEPALAQTKREVSETSLSSIPLNRVVMKKRYSQREVDMQKASQLSEGKLKKKESVEAELQGAIAALKRPNARAAVKEYVEASELRQTISHAKSKRTRERFERRC